MDEQLVRLSHRVDVVLANEMSASVMQVRRITIDGNDLTSSFYRVTKPAGNIIGNLVKTAGKVTDNVVFTSHVKSLSSMGQ